jgi:hypothetical protein
VCVCERERESIHLQNIIILGKFVYLYKQGVHVPVYFHDQNKFYNNIQNMEMSYLSIISIRSVMML